jgi:hypothetical protein
LADGSYLSRIYPSDSDRRHQRNGVSVRVIEYCARRFDFGVNRPV